MVYETWWQCPNCHKNALKLAKEAGDKGWALSTDNPREITDFSWSFHCPHCEEIIDIRFMITSPE